ncbi:MAG: hypothetical protein WCD66_10790 [Rhodanobacteraceae bacterium]
MKKRMAWVAVSVLLIVATGFALYLHQARPRTDIASAIRVNSGAESVAETNSSAIDKSRIVGHTGTTIPPGSSVPGNTVKRPLLGVTTFQELAQNLQNGPRGERLHMLWTAASVCDFHRSQGIMEVGARDDHDQWLDHFCQSYSGDAENYLQEMNDLPASSELAQAQSLSSIAGTSSGKSDAITVARHMVRSTAQPAVLEIAGVYLANTGKWKVGAEFAAASGATVQLPKAQRLAVKLLTCGLSGGCGPGAWTTMFVCGGAHRCSPGITAYEVWRYTYSPQVYQLALKIEEQLLAERAGHRNPH